jgi:alpha-ketoglutarate-dependent taurine dioxygenase
MTSGLERRVRVTRQIRFVPLGQGPGQEVRGLDLALDLHPGTASALRLALLRHRVLRLPDQDLAALDRAAIARWLAPEDLDAAIAAPGLVIETAPAAPTTRTLYLDPFAAAAHLPDAWRPRVETLGLVEDGADGRLHGRLLRTDPATGRTGLHLGHASHARLRGVATETSSAILDALWAVLLKPEAVSVVVWRQSVDGRGDVVLRAADVSVRHEPPPASAEAEAAQPYPETLWKNTLFGLPWLPQVHEGRKLEPQAKATVHA